jgi:hypothetical protein
VYLPSHGVIKLWLVIGLMRGRLQCYPIAISAFAFFIAYQLYRFNITHSIWLLAITAVDVVVIVLTWHQYRYLLRRRDASIDGALSATQALTWVASRVALPFVGNSIRAATWRLGVASQTPMTRIRKCDWMRNAFVPMISCVLTRKRRWYGSRNVWDKPRARSNAGIESDAAVSAWRRRR